MNTEYIEVALERARAQSAILDPPFWSQIESACITVIEAIRSNDSERIHQSRLTAITAEEAAWTAWEGSMHLAELEEYEESDDETARILSAAQWAAWWAVRQSLVEIAKLKK